MPTQGVRFIEGEVVMKKSLVSTVVFVLCAVFSIVAEAQVTPVPEPTTTTPAVEPKAPDPVEAAALKQAKEDLAFVNAELEEAYVVWKNLRTPWMTAVAEYNKAKAADDKAKAELKEANEDYALILPDSPGSKSRLDTAKEDYDAKRLKLVSVDDPAYAKNKVEYDRTKAKYEYLLWLAKLLTIEIQKTYPLRVASPHPETVEDIVSSVLDEATEAQRITGSHLQKIGEEKGLLKTDFEDAEKKLKSLQGERDRLLQILGISDVKESINDLRIELRSGLAANQNEVKLLTTSVNGIKPELASIVVELAKIPLSPEANAERLALLKQAVNTAKEGSAAQKEMIDTLKELKKALESKPVALAQANVQAQETLDWNPQSQNWVPRRCRR
jgi:multidrug efflux pump subunit AcrA (membrane-fusion protein)